jgi:nitrate/TMAO reductase-like tetraheme cytochrome c subunit
MATASADETRPASDRDFCAECHSDPDLFVTNKKLYDYYQQWQNSVHEQEGVACDDCHGGDPSASDKDESHGLGVAESDPDSGIYYANVPATCGGCHEEILESFTESEHFKHVKKEEEEQQGPTCVSCHGSIEPTILDVNSVADTCVRCHNEKSDNHPEHPEKAREILNRFLSIQRFYRYIAIRATPDEAQKFFTEMDVRMGHLALTWHGFDLEKIDAETAEVLTTLKAKRDEIRQRRKKSK